MDLSAIIALGAAVLILLIGFRVYLLDRGNDQYRAFGALCCLLSWMCFCWYEMGQTQELADAVFWRRMQSVWTLANPLIVYCCWHFASIHLPPVSKTGRWLFSVFILWPAILFFVLEVFTTHTHGKVIPMENGNWGIALEGLHLLDIARGIWTFLVYSSAIYFIYRVWRVETIRFRKNWLLFLVILLTLGASMTILQNYILSPSGIVLPINESWNTLISILFFGWALSDFKIFNFKPESAFEHVADSMTNLMIVTNVNFQIKKISASAQKFFLTDAFQARNADLRSVIGEEAAQKLLAHLDTRSKQEINFRLGDRNVSILFSISRICNRRGRLIGYVFVGNDLTDYYRALDEVKHYNAQLEDSNNALEHFAFAVSHDLKAPLRTVHGFIELLDKRIHAEDKDTQEFLYHINQGIVRMNALIDGILNVSTLGHEPEKDEIIHLERILLEVRDKLWALCNQKSGLIRFEDHLPAIYGSHHQISLLFQNLIENGLKYNDHPQPVVTVSGKLTDDGYVFSVQDNGIGIAPQHRQRVFKMFERLHSWQDYEGTGLGLNMCQKVVEKLRGRIWIESPENGSRGTVFKLWIPSGNMALPPRSAASGKKQYNSMNAGY